MQQLLFVSVLIFGFLFFWALSLRERYQKEKAKSFRLNQEIIKLKSDWIKKELQVGELLTQLGSEKMRILSKANELANKIKTMEETVVPEKDYTHFLARIEEAKLILKFLRS